MVGHLITLIIDAQQVIHAIRCQFLDDGVGLLADRDVHHLGHRSVVVHVASIGSPDVVRTDRVTVYPLSQAGVTREPEQFQDLHAADVSVTVLSQRTREPTDTGRASDRVQAESPDGLAVDAVDGEAHCGPVDVASIGPLGVSDGR